MRIHLHVAPIGLVWIAPAIGAAEEKVEPGFVPPFPEAPLMIEVTDVTEFSNGIAGVGK